MPYLYTFLFIGGLVGVDQIVKWLTIQYLQYGAITIIPQILDLTYVENRGAGFGILQNQRWILIVITSCFILFLLKLLLRDIPMTKRYTLLRICFMVLIAGAIGNLIDRIVKGYVTDMIYFKPTNFPVFNVADIFVVCSSISLILLVLTIYRKDELLK